MLLTGMGSVGGRFLEVGTSGGPAIGLEVACRYSGGVLKRWRPRLGQVGRSGLELHQSVTELKWNFK